MFCGEIKSRDEKRSGEERSRQVSLKSPQNLGGEVQGTARREASGSMPGHSRNCRGLEWSEKGLDVKK